MGPEEIQPKLKYQHERLTSRLPSEVERIERLMELIEGWAIGKEGVEINKHLGNCRMKLKETLDEMENAYRIINPKLEEDA